MIKDPKRPENNFFKGIILILFADIFMTGQVVCVRLSSKYMSTNFICCFRSLITLVIVMTWIKISKSKLSLKTLFTTNRFFLHMVRASFATGAIYGFYYGISKLSISLGSLLYYTFPLFVPLVSRVWLGVKIIPRIWWGIGLAFMGIAIVLGPGSSSFNFFMFIPICAAIFIAISGIGTRVLYYTDSGETILLYYVLFSAVVTTVIFLAFNNIHTEILNTKSLFFVISTGVFAALFLMFYTFAAQYAPIRLLSPFIYVSFIFVALTEMFVWKNRINLQTIVGFIIIVVGTTLMILLYPKNDLKFVRKKSIINPDR